MKQIPPKFAMEKHLRTLNENFNARGLSLIMATNYLAFCALCTLFVRLCMHTRLYSVYTCIVRGNKQYVLMC